MKKALVAVAIIASACQSVVPPVQPQAVTTVQQPGNDADVIIVGSSLAGWAAAIASAREGADTILITETECIGGQASCAGVSTWDDFLSPHETHGLDFFFQYTLDGEYRNANVRIGGCYNGVGNPGPEHFLENDNFCPHADRVEDELLSWLNQYGVRLVGPVDVTEIETNGAVVTQEGTLRAEVVIEATENGELIPASLRRPVDENCKQETTWVIGIREPGPSGLPTLNDVNYPTDPAYMQTLEDWWDGTVQYHWNGLTGEEGFPLYRRTRDLNGDLVLYLNWLNDAPTASESLDLSRQMLVFLSMKGYGDWHYGERPIPYTRTSDYRLNGQTHFDGTVRGVDSWPDSVAVANYPSDYHGEGCIGESAKENGGDYDIPIGIGIPAERVPILTALPRSGDVSDLRASSLRMQPDEIAFGEAMGVTAAFAALGNILPHDVDVNTIRAKLVEHGARVDVAN